MRRRACLCDLRASVERACGPHYDRWPVTPSPRRRERPPAPSRFPPNETFARVFVPDNIRPSQHTNATRSFQSKLKKIARATSETNGTGEKRIFEDRGGREREREKEGRADFGGVEREREREPLSWHPAQRVQNDAEAGRGESSRTAPRRGGGGSAGLVVGRGGSIEWEDWGPVPRRAKVGGVRSVLVPLAPWPFSPPSGGRAEGEERHGGCR